MQAGWQLAEPQFAESTRSESSDKRSPAFRKSRAFGIRTPAECTHNHPKKQLKARKNSMFSNARNLC
jgi:hypothetical protein